MSRPFRNHPEQYRRTRPFRTHPEQFRNAPELTQPPGLYSTHGKQGIPPTNGQLGGTTHPIQQHTSMQSTPWPPSYSLTSTTSILDPPWAWPTWCLQGWPASMCLRPNDLETFRHAQGCPDSSSCDLAHQVHPDHPKTAKNHEDGINWAEYWNYSLHVRRESTLDHQLTTTIPPLLKTKTKLWAVLEPDVMHRKPGKVQRFWKPIRSPST